MQILGKLLFFPSKHVTLDKSVLHDELFQLVKQKLYYCWMFIKVNFKEMMILHIGFPLLKENERNEFQINSLLFKNNKKRNAQCTANRYYNQNELEVFNEMNKTFHCQKKTQ